MNGNSALKSVFYTVGGGVPDKNDAWLWPGMTTTGYLLLAFSNPKVEFNI